MRAWDRDGTVIGSWDNWTLNHPKLINSPEDQKIIQPIADIINREGGVIVSNQQGVLKGYKTLEQVIAEFQWLMEQIPGIQESYFCTDEGYTCVIINKRGIMSFHHSDTPRFRKPLPGMLEKVKRYYRGNVTEYIGDLSGLVDWADGLDTDRQAAITAGMTYKDVREVI